MLEIDNIYNEDCLEGMKRLDDHSIDMVICDLPYGTTSCKWDVVIPFEPLWEQYHRVVKENGAIVLFGSEPFSTYMRMSNIREYKYDWIWEKSKASNFQLAKKNPLKYHESISVFYREFPTYNNLDLKPCNIKSGRRKDSRNLKHITGGKEDYVTTQTGYNGSILYFPNPSGAGHLHPTQKPVELVEYLVRVYTNEGDLVLDNCMGSGTTAIAALRCGRRYIGFETDGNYCDVANKRVDEFNEKIRVNSLW